jgi:tetratricopeptide (TPR) repeat protein
VKTQSDLIKELESLRGLLIAIEEGPAEGLRHLESRTDPEAIRRRLTILIDNQEYDSAVELAKSAPRHVRWVEKGMISCIISGDFDYARSLLEWARVSGDRNLLRSMILSFSRTARIRLLNSRMPDDPFLPGRGTQAETEILTEIVQRLAPLASETIIAGAIANSFEELAIENLSWIHYMLGDAVETSKYSKLLLTRKPVSLECARLALQYAFSPPDDLASRLRSEHPREIQAHTLACIIDARLNGDVTSAFKFARELFFKADDAGDRVEILKVLSEFASQLDIEQVEEVTELAESVEDAQGPVARYLKVRNDIGQGRYTEAIENLEQISERDDPTWMQLYANALLAAGRGKDAIPFLDRASDILPEPALLRNAASLAFRYDEWAVATDKLNKLLTLLPNDTDALITLATIHNLSDDWTRAAQVYERLTDIEPANAGFQLRKAYAWLYAGALSKAEEAFSQLVHLTDAPVEATIGLARTLMLMSRGRDALDTLAKRRHDSWDNVDYLLASIDIGFSANDEELANSALLHLNELQRSLPEDQHPLQQKGLEEVKEFIQSRHDLHEEMSTQLVQGTIPWLWKDWQFNMPSMLAWMARTQPLGWVHERVSNWSSYVVYASNRYFPFADQGKRRLGELTCPPHGTAIVVDLSALLTLSELKILEAAADYFGRVIVPSGYLSQMIEDSGRLIPHQKSQQLAVDAVFSCILSARIKVLGTPPQSNQFRIDEYNDNDDVIRIRSIIQSLHVHAVISDRTLQYAMEKTENTKRQGSEVSIPIGAELVIEAATLKALAQLDLLSHVTQSFRVFINSIDFNRLQSEKNAFEVQSLAANRHKCLWDSIHADPRFVHQATPLSMSRTDGAVREVRVALASAEISKESRIPLCADDRCVQSYVLLNHPDWEFGAFGSEQVLQALYQTGAIDLERLSDAYLRLVSWRYRFLVIPSDVLVTIAHRFSSYPPGGELQSIAKYVHDCMRDPGLFSGLESTDPSSRIALRLYTSWCAEIGSFLMKIHLDPRIPKEAAHVLTLWSASELVPMPPLNFGDRFGGVEAATPTLVLGSALLSGASHKETGEANAALVAIARALQITDEEYLSSVLGAFRDS